MSRPQLAEAFLHKRHRLAHRRPAAKRGRHRVYFQNFLFRRSFIKAAFRMVNRAILILRRQADAKGDQLFFFFRQRSLGKARFRKRVKPLGYVRKFFG